MIAAVCLAGAVVAIPVVAGAYGGGDAPAAKTMPSGEAKERPTTATRRVAASAKRATASARARTTLRVSKRPSDRARLKLAGVISGNISPKSVASSGAGYVTAQNMMYRHSVTVYDAATLKLVKTISDSVNLPKLGYREYGTAKGAPVEAAFSSDGRYAFVSNYSMYGAGFGPEGSDSCTPSSGTSRSFVYRIDMKTLAIDRAYRVGAVPKVVAVTPDDRFVLVSNWCTWDLSVISTKLGREVKRIPIGPYPRGIAVSPKGNAAYVAVMGGNELVRVDLGNWSTSRVGVGAGPRAAVFHPSDRYIFATLNAEGRVAKLDLRDGGRAGEGRDGQRAAQHGHLGRRALALRRQLRERHGDEAANVRHEPAADDRCVLSPDRDHVRQGDQARVGRLLHRLDPRLQRLVAPPPAGQPCSGAVRAAGVRGAGLAQSGRLTRHTSNVHSGAAS